MPPYSGAQTLLFCRVLESQGVLALHGVSAWWLCGCRGVGYRVLDLKRVPFLVLRGL